MRKFFYTLTFIFVLCPVFFACSLDPFSEIDEREEDSRTAEENAENTTDASSVFSQKAFTVAIENAVSVVYTRSGDAYIASEELSAAEKKSVSAQNIVIKENIDSIPVVAIADNAFSNLASVKTIAIPASIEKIGSDAFSHCQSISDIYFAKTENDLFALDGGLSFYNRIESLNDGVQWHYESLGPKPVALAELSVESDNNALTAVWNYGDGEKTGFIRLKLESENENPQCVEIRDNAISSYTFSSLVNGQLYKISAVAVNVFEVESDALTISAQPKPKENVFTADEIELALSENAAFYRVVKNESTKDIIAIPSFYNEIPVSEIENIGSSTLSALIIPASVRKIAAGAFSPCQSIPQIFFAGTAAEWATIAGIENISGAKIVFNSLGPFFDDTGFEFRKNDNYNSYSLVGYHGNADTIEIPGTFNGCPVTAIAQNAFSGTEGTIVSVKIPETVSEISKNVFSGFQNLKSAFFAGSEKSIAIASGNKNLQNVLWYDTICVAKNNFRAVLARRKGEKSLTILEYETADEFANVGEITHWYDVSTIASGAFSKSLNTKYIVIPSEILVVKSGAFSACTGLEAIWTESEKISVEAAENAKVSEILEVVSSLNSISKTADGFIVADSTLLKYVGTAKTVKIPEGITRIAKNAFRENQTIDVVQFSAAAKLVIGSFAFYGSSVRKIVIPEQIKSINIEKYAFAECKNLSVSVKDENKYSGEAFLVPTSVTKIGEGAFSGCSSLVSVRFDSVGWPMPAVMLSELPDRCFENCSSLENVYLGSQISVLKNYVFRGCGNLSQIQNESTLSFLDSTNAGIRLKLQ